VMVPNPILIIHIDDLTLHKSLSHT